jgi:hypothetical protein
MASSKRLVQAVSVLSRPTSTPYVCAACRSSNLPHSSQQVRHNSDLPFTEKLRRKIWGTDNPPGLKDPYGGPSFWERRRAEKERARLQQSGESEQQPQTDLEPDSRSRPQLELSPTTARETSDVDRSPAVLDRADAEQYQSIPAEPYKKATTWDGLDWVGHKGEYKFQNPKEGDVYVP